MTYENEADFVDRLENMYGQYEGQGDSDLQIFYKNAVGIISSAADLLAAVVREAELQNAAELDEQTDGLSWDDIVEMLDEEDYMATFKSKRSSTDSNDETYGTYVEVEDDETLPTLPKDAMSACEILDELGELASLLGYNLPYDNGIVVDG